MRLIDLRTLLVAMSLCGYVAAQTRLEPPRSTEKDGPRERQVVAADKIGSGARIASDTSEPLPVPLIARTVRNEGSSTTAAGGSETIVYTNASDNPSVYRPGAGQRLADDIELASNGCPMVRYGLVVFGNAQSGSPTFNVHTELWNGDPCDAPVSTVIPGTAHDFLNVPNDQSAVELNAFFDAVPVNIPKNVFLAVTFNPTPAGNDAGWVVAGKSELGFTANFWSEAVLSGNPPCDQFYFGCNSYAGFWSEIACQLPAPPSGACCNGDTCTQTTEANCQAGAWKGPFSGCNPSPCVNGACCSDVALTTCTETTQADCEGGLFVSGATCAASPCTNQYTDFANTYDITGFHRAQAGALRADDLRLSGAEPCELAGYSVAAIGNGLDGPPRFNATVELWFNSLGVDPFEELDDFPASPIQGTRAVFTNIPADFCQQDLIMSAPPGVVLPNKVWVVFSADSTFAGPFLAGPAKLGKSLDAFAQFDTDAAPDRWQPGFWFGGFNPDGCPDNDPCTPAGSFRVTLWCRGDRPIGACCSDRLGTCTDGVTQPECSGRWNLGETCAENTFDPPCGVGACCAPSPLNPNVLACRDLTQSECDAEAGAFSRGAFCSQTTCPSLTCFNATGSCFAEHNSKGCDDAFCCEKICATDDLCCTNLWDDVCAVEAVQECQTPANDVFGGAKPITGEGTFDFDTTRATGQGPDHGECSSLGDIDGIADDQWFCWTSPCSAFVTADTCNPIGVSLADMTLVDTKLAVYNGCAAIPTDANLLVCDDDACGFQSKTRFVASAGQKYLIRVGAFPGTQDGGVDFPVRPRGKGKLHMDCFDSHHPSCPGTGSCCGDTNSKGCTDVACCDLVCACDSYCCDTEWDELCAAFGEDNSGCGALALCENLCATTCPIGNVTFTDPPTGVVDARQPIDPLTGTVHGIRTIVVDAPTGAQNSCFQPCETAAVGGVNGIQGIVETPIGGGVSMYTITLDRPITPLATTTITYRDDANVTTIGKFTSHPGNVNGDAAAGMDDIQSLIARLNGIVPEINAPWGHYSSDVDNSGATTSADLAAAVDALNGAGVLEHTDGTERPPSTCP